MNNKLGKTLKGIAAKWKLGDFFRNFIAVMLGIIITFIGSDMIEEHNTNNDVKRALVLVKNELQANKEELKEAQQWIMQQKAAARFLLRYKDKLREAPADSLEMYVYPPFQWKSVHFTNDALELLKSSSLFQKINDEQLALSLIKVYGNIDHSSANYQTFNETKQKQGDNLLQISNFKDFILKPMSPAERAELILSFPEGIAFIKQIPEILGSEHPFEYTLEEIDNTISAIESY